MSLRRTAYCALLCAFLVGGGSLGAPAPVASNVLLSASALVPASLMHKAAWSRGSGDAWDVATESLLRFATDRAVRALNLALDGHSSEVALHLPNEAWLTRHPRYSVQLPKVAAASIGFGLAVVLRPEDRVLGDGRTLVDRHHLAARLALAAAASSIHMLKDAMMVQVASELDMRLLVSAQFLSLGCAGLYFGASAGSFAGAVYEAMLQAGVVAGFERLSLQSGLEWGVLSASAWALLHAAKVPPVILMSRAPGSVQVVTMPGGTMRHRLCGALGNAVMLSVASVAFQSLQKTILG